MCQERHNRSVPLWERRPQQQSVMATTGARLTISLLFVGALYTSVDAAITEWTEPVATGKDINATAATTIAESLTTATSTGVTIQATGTGKVTYVISSQPTAGKLTIASDSGLLTLAVGTFDFETEPTYVLVIEATDDSDSTIGTGTVTLGITNVNEAPAFAPAQYPATVPDASTGGASVTTVTATDVDAGDTITYSITGGTSKTDFAIDGTTGAITVATGKTLAAGTLASYTLTVTATDTAGLNATATVSITVKDVANSGDGTAPIVNKSDPVFSATYSPCIADKSLAGTTLTTVTATVKDTTDTFTYAIASGNTGDVFKIDATGLIKVNDAKTLDKATTASYDLVVTATTTVVPVKTATTTVSVTVADFCDSGTAVVAVSMVMLIVSIFVTLF